MEAPLFKYFVEAQENWDGRNPEEDARGAFKAAKTSIDSITQERVNRRKMIEAAEYREWLDRCSTIARDSKWREAQTKDNMPMVLLVSRNRSISEQLSERGLQPANFLPDPEKEALKARVRDLEAEVAALRQLQEDRKKYMLYG